MYSFTLATKNLDCNYHVLSETSDGLMYKCDHCGAVNVVYKNIGIKLNIQTYRQFYEALRGAYERFMNRVDSTDLIIKVATPYVGIDLLFTQSEMEDLLDMINRADLLIQVTQLTKISCNE